MARTAQIASVAMIDPIWSEVRREAEALAQVEEYLRSGAWMKFHKHTKFQAHQRRTSAS